MLTPLRSPVPAGDRYVGAKIYPTGEGVIFPRNRKKISDTHALQDIRDEYEGNKDFHEENSKLFGMRDACSKLLAISALNSNMQAGGVLGEGESLDSSSDAISHSHRNRRGSTGLSAHNKRLLRFAASTVEKRAGSPTRLSFLTLTLPPMSPESWKSVLGGWGDIVRTFNQWLTRRLKSKSLPALLVGCTELQPARSLRTGEPALHIHIVFQGRARNSGWAVNPSQCRSAWKRAIEGQTDEQLRYESTENLCQVRRSAASYLAKYMSKGSSEWFSNVSPEYHDLHPTSWLFTPDCLKRLYHSETWVGDEALAVLTLAVNYTQYRFGEVRELPIYQLPNGQWVKVVLIKLDRNFAKSLSKAWCP